MFKRLNNSFCQLTCGSVIGHHHVATKTNKQDSYMCLSNDQKSIGIVVDGCSASIKAEISHLVADFMVHYIDNCSINNTNIKRILSETFSATKEYINSIINLTRPYATKREKALLIQDCFMAVVVGFYIDHSQEKQPGAVFYCGDPIFSFDNQPFVVIDQNNFPHYLMYACIDKELMSLHEMIPSSFTSICFDFEDYNRFMIAQQHLFCSTDLRVCFFEYRLHHQNSYFHLRRTIFTISLL